MYIHVLIPVMEYTIYMHTYIHSKKARRKCSQLLIVIKSLWLIAVSVNFILLIHTFKYSMNSL